MFLTFNFLYLRYLIWKNLGMLLVPGHISCSSRREQTLIMIKDNNYPVIEELAMGVKLKLKI